MPPRPKARSRHRGRIGFIFLCVLVIGGAGIGWRLYQSSKLKKATNESAETKVAVITPASGGTDEELVLPGNVQAWHEATIYARTNGYLKKMVHANGDESEAGRPARRNRNSRN